MFGSLFEAIKQNLFYDFWITNQNRYYIFDKTKISAKLRLPLHRRNVGRYCKGISMISASRMFGREKWRKFTLYFHFHCGSNVLLFMWLVCFCIFEMTIFSSKLGVKIYRRRRHFGSEERMFESKFSRKR